MHNFIPSKAKMEKFKRSISADFSHSDFLEEEMMQTSFAVMKIEISKCRHLLSLDYYSMA